jgi:hypothetical protein
MTTTKLASRCAALLLLLACTPEPVEEWKREAIAQRKSFAGREISEWDTYPARINSLLDKPDPPAVVGPELPVRPATGDAIAWPPPKDGVLTVRYRIEGADCGGYGSDMGCHLVALCPVDTPPGTAPAAERFDSTKVEPQPIKGVTTEVLEVPNPRCELRLYARDHHGSVMCTARGPKLPASWTGGAVIDVGTVVSDHGSCQPDELGERTLFRGQLIRNWRERQAKKR